MHEISEQYYEDSNGIVIVAGGVSSTGKIKKALHEEIEIKYFYEGSSTLIVGKQTVEVQAGDVVVINPYEFHSTIDYGKENGKYHIFMVPLDYFEENTMYRIDLRNFFFVRQKSFDTLHKNTKMAEILKRAVEEIQNKRMAYHIALRSLMMEFFVMLLREGITDKEDYRVDGELFRHYRLIEPALRHVRDNYHNMITVEELAELCRISKYYFCHIFKAVTGKTVMEYLREYRIKTADIMLVNSDESIEVIAERCGFESVHYFHRCYKKYFEFSPGKRRREKKG